MTKLLASEPNRLPNPHDSHRRHRPRLLNLFILTFGEILTRGFTFVAFIWLGPVLGVTAFGLVHAAFSVMMLCTLFVDQGFGIFGAREIAKDPDAQDQTVHRVMSAQLQLAIGVFGLLLAATWVVSMPEPLRYLLRGLAVSLLGMPFLLNWVFQGRNEMFWFTAPMALRQAVFLVLTLLLVHKPEHIWRLAAAEVGAVTVAGICYLAVIRRQGGQLQRPSLLTWDRLLFRDVLPIGGSQIIWSLRMYIPTLFVLHLIDATAAGYFAVPHRLVMFFQGLLSVYFTNLFPAMSAAYSHHKPSMIGLLIRWTLLSLVPTVALALLVVFTAPMMIRVFGAEYVSPESVRAMIVMTWMIPVLALHRAGRDALFVLNHQGTSLKCSVIGMMTMIVLVLLLTRPFGIVGCAWGMFLAQLVITALIWLALVPLLKDLETLDDIDA